LETHNSGKLFVECLNLELLWKLFVEYLNLKESREVRYQFFFEAMVKIGHP
jgi:hypothetical protein